MESVIQDRKGAYMRPSIQIATIRKAILAAMFILALAASVAAAPQRGAGHFGNGAARNHAGSGSRAHVAVPYGQFRGHARFRGHERHVVVPRHHVVVPHRHVGVPHARVIVRGGFYDPFWSPYHPYYWGYPYAYPYGAYDYSLTSNGDVQTKVTPKQTEVYVDGYYAGLADNFDGAFQRLHVTSGGHAVSLHLDGYRTVTQEIYVRPGSTYTLRETMERLAPGDVSEPVPVPSPVMGR